jgi:hypothetical protein
MMINRLLRIMWPKLTESIFKMVIGVVKPMVQDMLNKVGVYLGCYGWGEGTAACLFWSAQIGLNNTCVVGADAQYG